MKPKPIKVNAGRLTLHESSDLSLFLWNKVQRIEGEGQRKLEAHIRDIALSMKTWGFLASKPVHVVREGLKLRVIDGHNRMEAAKLAKVPVIFQVGDAKEAGAMLDINRNTKVWTMRNYADAHARKGNLHFIKLLQYVKQGIPLNMAASLMLGHGAVSGVGRDLIPSGTFTVKTTTVIDSLVDFLKRVPPSCKEMRSNSYMAAIALMTEVDGFDINVFLRKLLANERALVKVACRDQALEVIEDIHNYRSFNKPNLAHTAKRIMAERNANRPKAA